MEEIPDTVSFHPRIFQYVPLKIRALGEEDFVLPIKSESEKITGDRVAGTFWVPLEASDCSQ